MAFGVFILDCDDCANCKFNRQFTLDASVTKKARSRKFFTTMSPFAAHALPQIDACAASIPSAVKCPSNSSGSSPWYAVVSKTKAMVPKSLGNDSVG